MPLDGNRPATRVEAVAEAFAAITLTPRPKGNADAVAVEYFVASTLLSVAEKRRDAAKKEAVAAGVIPNGGLSIGTHPGIYRGEMVEISATVVAQADKLDGAGKDRIAFIKAHASARSWRRTDNAARRCRSCAGPKPAFGRCSVTPTPTR